MANLAHQAASLLDFNQKLDIGLLDNVVVSMYAGNGETQRVAQEVLTTLKEHPDAWTRVDTILEYSSNQQTKYYALQILEQVIKTRWKVLPRNQCEGIKKYIVALIIKTSSDPQSLEENKTYLNKLNIILVQVLKREWPKNWESFIPDIVGASRTNESLCQNNMIILQLLSEELFDFSSGQVTQVKAKHLKDTMCSEFSAIFHLCQFVLENSQNPPLVNVTLDTLLRFLNWIPLGYIFETKLVATLIGKFLPVPLFRNVTLKCLTEIAGLTVSTYDNIFVELFTETMKQLEIMLPLQTDIRASYSCGQDQEQNFIQNLALFLCTFLKEHSHLVEQNAHTLRNALHYLVLISEVDEVEIFKICLEYWNSLASELYKDVPYSGPLYTGSRKVLYHEVLNKVRYIMISRMAKPEEVLVVENDNGEVVREFMKDTDSINLYKNMRETLVYLTHLDYLDTERIMIEKLQNQVNGSEWSWKNLNTLCWAIGSISGAMHEEDEKRFLVTVIKDLLGLCEQKRGKDNKAIIASNIMYVVGQYPRFLRAHWKFLKTVVNKLFEFMHEAHDGVQDMACDTFIKIAVKCRRHFVTLQAGETCPFIEEILTGISTIICDLQTQQVHTFYEAVGYMIAAQADSATQEALIEKYMLLPNQVWDDIISQASKNVDVLKDIHIVKQLASILKTNVRACKALGHAYVTQLGRIYLDMLSVYKVMSENITQAIVLNGEGVTNQPLIKSMRVVKKETLKLIADWISKSNDHVTVSQNFIPPLLDAVLLDYQRTTAPSAREPEVLNAMATIVNKLEGHITAQVPTIFDAVFECTLDMINKDFEEYPDHRTNFFLLLQAVNNHCFPAFLSIPPAQFKLVLDSIIWAFKHTMRNVAETGLQILQRLLTNIESNKQAAPSFYQTYLTDILQHIFSVVTDTSHTAGLSMHATILAYIFLLVESNKLNCQLGPTPDNVLYIQEFTATLLRSAFPHLTDNQIKITVQGMFNLNQDVSAFREHLRDFLVQIRLLSKELFDFSSGQVAQIKAKHLKDTMFSEFSAIFHLCQFVLENSQNPPLVNVILDTLLRFLNWIPSGYIFETKLVATLIGKLLPVPLFRNVTLKCLTEIAGLTVSTYDNIFVELFTEMMKQLEIKLPLQTDIRASYSCEQDQEQNFIQNLALFLCTFLKEHSHLVEQNAHTLRNALHYLVLISEVDEVKIFKICLEYWNSLASELYKDIPYSGPLYTGSRKVLYHEEYTGEDDSDLYLEEREKALQQAQSEKLRVQLSVPGILNPHEVPEEMQD